MGRGEAEELDRCDPLGSFTDEFVAADPDLVYFDGNSLGRLPRRTVARLQAAVDEWGSALVRGWETWIDLPVTVGDRLGTAALGAAPGQVALSDSTTVNFYKVAAAALDAQPERRIIVTDRHNFPTDRYVLDGLAQARGLEVRQIDPDLETGVDRAHVAAATDGDVALVTFSAVDYRSGAIADVRAITADAHAAGALTVWDFSHAAGAIPLSLDDWGVDLAVGCSYKYLNGGPGAPAWLYVAAHLQEELVPPIWGWFGTAEQFARGPRWAPAPGIRRWLAGTPPVLALAAVDEGIAMLAAAGIGPVRTKGIALTTFAEERWREWLAPLGFALGSPPVRGSHLALCHPHAWGLTQALARDAAVVADFRAPDVLRIGLSPLSTRFTDVWDGLERLRDLAADAAWRRHPETPGRVT
ncbi:MAG: kynureninase [Acidimicrobiales bacterium]